MSAAWWAAGLLAVSLAGCVHPSEKDADSGKGDGWSVPRPPWSTGLPGFDSAGPDSGDSAPPDTGDGGPPAYPCAPPPEDAIPLLARGYLGDAEMYAFDGGRTRLQLHALMVNVDSPRCFNAQDLTGAAYDEEPGAWVAQLFIDAPLRYPGSYEGAYAHAIHPLVGSLTDLGFSIDFWRYTNGRRDDYTTDYVSTGSGFYGDGSLCLARFRPDRVTGSVVYRAREGDPRGVPALYIAFDMRTSDPTDTLSYDDGTCFHYGYFGIDSDTLWTPGYGQAH